MQNTAAADDTEKTKGAAPAIFGIDIRFLWRRAEVQNTGRGIKAAPRIIYNELQPYLRARNFANSLRASFTISERAITESAMANTFTQSTMFRPLVSNTVPPN